MATLLTGDTQAPTVMLFGSGTVGRPVRQHLERRGHVVRRTTAIPWTDPTERRIAIDGLLDELRHHGRRVPIRIVWAAGAAGFSVAQAVADQEAAALDDVVRLTARLLEDRGDAPHRLHVVSSAGGLFEGMTVRASDAAPQPRRVYGRLKLQQEEAARRLPDGTVVVHRPSSIYGSSSHGRRPGLIGTLVDNTLAGRLTTVYGAPTTLRDYVHADDIGRHIANAALAASCEATPELLVAGRPRSIHEIVRQVESLLRRATFLHFVQSWNASDIVFTPSARSPSFRPSALTVGIQRVRADLFAAPR